MESLRPLEDRLRAVAGANASGLLIMSKQGEIVFADAAAEAFFQRKAGAMIGETFVDVLAAHSALEFGLESVTGAASALMGK